MEKEFGLLLISWSWNVLELDEELVWMELGRELEVGLANEHLQHGIRFHRRCKWRYRQRHRGPYSWILIYSYYYDQNAKHFCLRVASLHNLSLNICSWIFQVTLFVCSDSIWCFVAVSSGKNVSQNNGMRALKATWSITWTHMNYPPGLSRKLVSKSLHLFQSCCCRRLDEFVQLHKQMRSIKQSGEG